MVDHTDYSREPTVRVSWAPPVMQFFCLVGIIMLERKPWQGKGGKVPRTSQGGQNVPLVLAWRLGDLGGGQKEGKLRGQVRPS